MPYPFENRPTYFLEGVLDSLIETSVDTQRNLALERLVRAELARRKGSNIQHVKTEFTRFPEPLY